MGGKVNEYTCDRKHVTVTIHADDGVTPFMIACHRCGNTAISSCYQCNQSPKRVHGVWSAKQNKWWGEIEDQQRHAKLGGVFLYAVPVDKQVIEE